MKISFLLTDFEDDLSKATLSFGLSLGVCAHMCIYTFLAAHMGQRTFLLFVYQNPYRTTSMYILKTLIAFK